MCGIVGYIGNEDAKEFILQGLEKLEYRGYDSSGIAILNDQGIYLYKDKERIASLRDNVNPSVEANLGIGHTRWATHGAPTKLNAHPHMSSLGRFVIVHNGVIDNYTYLHDKYLENAYIESETDTEIIVQLIETFVIDGLSVLEAFKKVISLLEGSFAIVLMDEQDQDHLYVARSKSPLLIGKGRHFHIIASDTAAVYSSTNQFVELLDGECAVVTKNDIEISTLYDEVIDRGVMVIESHDQDYEKGSYEHYMMKEIEEQPHVIRRIISKYQGNMGNFELDQELIERIHHADRIYIIACGTSYHAGLVGKSWLEGIAKIPTEVHIASEFSYHTPLLTENPLFLLISQSGETADLRSVLVKIKEINACSVVMTNVVGSTLARESDYVLPLYAGPEFAVASTKAYTAQLALLVVLSTALAIKKGIDLHFNPTYELLKVADGMQYLISKKGGIEDIAWEYLSTAHNCFFIGRGIDYYVSLEAALKLKEISYIQAEGFPGGELKHGTLALIEKGTPVFALNTQANVNSLMWNNVKEVETRGAKVCLINDEKLVPGGEIELPHVHDYLSPIISVVPYQLLAYFAALHRSCDVDKPRNLAKSVTVE